MDTSQLILQHFPNLSKNQQKQFSQLKNVYQEWNEKINVISRKDIDNFYLKHCLHSLAIAKVYQFLPGQRILDVGTGGGFPGIPLAILFPETAFLLVDSIAKKLKVVEGVVETVGLQNVSTLHERAEKVKGKYHFVISRAVTRMKPFYQWIAGKMETGTASNGIDYGIFYLKGGDLTEEMAEVRRPFQLFALKDFYDDPFFETKKVVYLPK